MLRNSANVAFLILSWRVTFTVLHQGQKGEQRFAHVMLVIGIFIGIVCTPKNDEENVCFPKYYGKNVCLYPGI
jgi:hypothetical protein